MNTIGSGAGLSAQIMMAVDQLARELRHDHREQATHEADRALREGLAEAHSMHEQADEMARGALVSGVLTGAAGAAQLGAACVTTSAPGGSEAPASEAEMQSFLAHNKRLDMVSSGAGTLGQLSGVARLGYEARAHDKEADARVHSAQAQAANRRADAEQSAAQEEQRSMDKARDLHQQIVALEHASRMAALKG